MRSVALYLSAVPLVVWPGFLIAGAMPPPSGWFAENTFAGLFVYYAMLYPIAFFGARFASARLASRAQHRLAAIVAIAPVAVFGILGLASGMLQALWNASGR